MIKVFTTGTFDLLHRGHINLLKNAKDLGDYLIVGVNVSPTSKTPINSAEDRKLILESLKFVDEVILLNSQEDKFKYLETNHVDVFAIGSDYKDFYDIKDIEKYCEVKFIERTPDISTTQLKHQLIRREFNTIIVDIDDTILFTTNRDFINAVPNKEVINKINSLYDKGWNIILYTARGAKSCKTLEQRIEKYNKITTDWLHNNGVKYSELKFGKDNADYYVDDKNISIDEFLKLEVK